MSGFFWYILIGCGSSFFMMWMHCRQQPLQKDEFWEYIMCIVIWPIALLYTLSTFIYFRRSSLLRRRKGVQKPNRLKETIASWLYLQRDLSQLNGKAPTVEHQAQDLAEVLEETYWASAIEDTRKN